MQFSKLQTHLDVERDTKPELFEFVQKKQSREKYFLSTGRFFEFSGLGSLTKFYHVFLCSAVCSCGLCAACFCHYTMKMIGQPKQLVIHISDASG